MADWYTMGCCNTNTWPSFRFSLKVSKARMSIWKARLSVSKAQSSALKQALC